MELQVSQMRHTHAQYPLCARQRSEDFDERKGHRQSLFHVHFGLVLALSQGMTFHVYSDYHLLCCHSHSRQSFVTTSLIFLHMQLRLRSTWYPTSLAHERLTHKSGYVRGMWRMIYIASPLEMVCIKFIIIEVAPFERFVHSNTI